MGERFDYTMNRLCSVQDAQQGSETGRIVAERHITRMATEELKVDRFAPSDLGQLQFYLEALDRDVKKPHEEPSIGVLLCATKDDEVVEYALARTVSPALVAQYQRQLPDKQLLQTKLHEFYELAQAALPAPEDPQSEPFVQRPRNRKGKKS
jgi:YhcG PDDEXK nuclease domain